MESLPADQSTPSQTGPFELYASLSPAALSFVGQSKFHQVMRCHRTNMRVSFSEAGAPDGPVILVCLPSVCSRYVVGPSFEERANKFGVRLIAVDRPGTGGTERCEIEDRIRISTEHCVSVLEHLQISQLSAVFGHSAGSIYALHFLRSFPQLLGPNPLVYLTSPWVPTSASSQRSLTLVPTFLISNQHRIMPAIFPVANAVGGAFAFSSNLFKTGKDAADDWDFPARLRPEDGSPYMPQPPYHETGGPSKEITRLINRCAMMEPLQGCSQDYILCLGRQGGVNEAWYSQAVSDIAEHYQACGQKLHVEVWWAAKDSLVPLKGRKWFDELMRKPEGGIGYTSFELAGAGHDGPVEYAEVVPSIFEDVRRRTGEHS